MLQDFGLVEQGEEMRLKHSKKSLRRDFKNHSSAKGLLHEKDLRIGSSKLRAKLLIFKNATALRGFWKNALGHNLGRFCLGAVSSLCTNVGTIDRKGNKIHEYVIADKRYFCIIGLIKGHLGAEIVTHEAIHAGYCYIKRIRKTPWDEQIEHFDEESVAYPSGLIAAKINDVYWKLADKKG